jgi:hypothetical protein
MKTTGKTHGDHESLTAEDREKMANSVYAFASKRKEPLNDASHVRNAIARFNQVKDATDEEREEAFHKIKAAAKKYGVEMTETHWKQLGSKPHTANSAHHKAS